MSSLGAEDRTRVASRRTVDPARLAGALASDLDWIVMRCLEKDRGRRYESANAVAQDIRRFLDGQPIEARPPSAGYRMRKFIRRHRAGFLVVSGTTVVVIVGLIVSSVLLVRERVAHARALKAEQAENQLRREAESARDRETRSAARTALSVSRELLDRGRTADALAYLVHVARLDPESRTIAPRLAAVLTSRNFLIPERAPFACGSRVLAMRYTRDDRHLIVGCEDGTMRIFDAATGALTREVRFDREVKRSGWVFARDTDAVCAIGFRDDTVAIVDLPSGRMRFDPIQLDPRISSGDEPNSIFSTPWLRLSPNGRWLMAESFHALWMWDAVSGAAMEQRDFPENGKFCDISADGTRLAVAWNDAVTVYSLPEGGPVYGPVPIVRTSATTGRRVVPTFSRDDRQLIVTDPWEAIHVLDAACGNLVRSFPHSVVWALPGTVQILPDGSLFMVTESEGARLWDLEHGTARIVPTNWARTFRSSCSDATGSSLLMFSSTGLVRLSSAATGETIVEDSVVADYRGIVAALSASGERVAVGTGSGEIRWFMVGRGAARPLELAIHDAVFMKETPSRLRWLSAARTGVIDVARGRAVGAIQSNPRVLELTKDKATQFAPGGRFLMVEPGDEGWEFWDLSGEAAPRVFFLPVGPCATFSADGNFIASGIQDSVQVGVWNLQTGKPAGPFLSHGGQEVTCSGLALTPDGRYVATGDAKGTVFVWETSTGRLQAALDETLRGESVMEFHPDGRRLLVANHLGEVRLWDAMTGQPESPVITTVESYAEGLKAAPSPDGRWLAVVKGYGVDLLDTATFAPMGKTIPIDPRFRRVLGFSGDSTRLVASPDAVLWDVLSGEQITEPIDDFVNPLNTWFGFDESPDGRFNASWTLERTRLRSVPPRLPDGERTPHWLVKLAAVLSGKSINAADVCVADPSTLAWIDDVRRELAAQPADAPFVEWGRWFLDDSPDRPIAPGFTLTPAEAASLADDFRP